MNQINFNWIYCLLVAKEDIRTLLFECQKQTFSLWLKLSQYLLFQWKRLSVLIHFTHLRLCERLNNWSYTNRTHIDLNLSFAHNSINLVHSINWIYNFIFFFSTYFRFVDANKLDRMLKSWPCSHTSIERYDLCVDTDEGCESNSCRDISIEMQLKREVNEPRVVSTQNGHNKNK